MGEAANLLDVPSGRLAKRLFPPWLSEKPSPIARPKRRIDEIDHHPPIPSVIAHEGMLVVLLQPQDVNGRNAESQKYADQQNDNKQRPNCQLRPSHGPFFQSARFSIDTSSGWLPRPARATSVYINS
jgi:hypothetical protein